MSLVLPSPEPGAPRSLAPRAVVMSTLVLVLVVAMAAAASLGSIRLAPGDFLRALAGVGRAADEIVLFELRLPRVVLAVVVGAGLATSGAILQGVVRNVLADPGLLGINAGAGCAAAIYVGSLSVQSDQAALHSSLASTLGLPVAALGGGLAAAAAVYALANRDGVSPWRLVLVGIAVGQGLAAATMVALTRLTAGELGYAKIWLAGTIWNANWTFVLIALPCVLGLGAVAVARSRTLDVMGLGDTAATGLGVAIERERRLLLVVAAAMASVCVAVGGGIGFVGLFAPHIARRLVGTAHRTLLPASALIGGISVCVADRIGHALLAPHEIPAGVVVAGIGAPWFLWLLARGRA